MHHSIWWCYQKPGPHLLDNISFPSFLDLWFTGLRSLRMSSTSWWLKQPIWKNIATVTVGSFFSGVKIKKKYLSCHHLVLVSVVFFPDCFGFIGFPCHLFISSCGWFHGDVVCWIFQTFSDKDSMLTKLLNQGTIYHNINSSLGHKLWEQGVLNHIILITWVGNTTPAILLQNTTFQTKAVNLKDCWQPCNHHAVACSPFYQLLS